MEFVYPSFLYALAALAIPIIIHLFNFRRFKTLKFTNVRFLRDVKQQTKSRSTLKHLLVLLCRLIVIASLVLAFAQPYIPLNDESRAKGQQAVSIYLDNSFSMEAQASDGNLFNLAKNKAMRVLEAYGEGDKFQLLTNDFEGKHQRLVNKDVFMNYLQEVELSPRSKDISQVISRQKDLLKEHDPASQQYFLISDLQKSSFDIENLSADSSNFNVLPVQTDIPSNLYIDSIWFESPIRKAGSPVKLMVQITNKGDREIKDVPINLNINGTPKTPLSFSIAANENKLLEMSYTSNKVGFQNGKLSLKDYPVTFDDDFYFSYEQAENISILHIYDEKPSWSIAALFEEDDFFQYSTSNYKQLNYSGLADHQFLVLDELREFPTGLSSELGKFVRNGGSLIVFPAKEINENSYRNAMTSLGIESYGDKRKQEIKVSKINLKSDIYQNVFDEVPRNVNLPILNSYYRLSSYSSSNKENILALQNGDSYLNLYKMGEGKVYLFASSLSEEQSNLTSHAIFVPTLYNMALLSQAKQELFYFLDRDIINIAGLKTEEEPFHLIGDEVDIIPEQRTLNAKLQLKFHNEVSSAGFYKLMQDKNQLASIAFNYNRQESDLEFYEPEGLKIVAEESGLSSFNILSQSNESLSKTLKNINQGISLWKYFIVLALVFLGFEILFLRILK